MNHNEGRESYYRMHDSQIPPAWMDPENSTAFHIRSNLTEETTSSPSLDCSSPDQSYNGAVGDSAVGHTYKHVSSEELDRIRIRRERNREAAARCRDRRRILIDTLQNETDHLEHVKTQLEEEIAALEREREILELVFEAHMPSCKLNDPTPE
ncbi:hypothetical protein R3I94_016261 [Phoxinus phoxinus]